MERILAAGLSLALTRLYGQFFCPDRSGSLPAAQ
jgi:hypothetical protein